MFHALLDKQYAITCFFLQKVSNLFGRLIHLTSQAVILVYS